MLGPGPRYFKLVLGKFAAPRGLHAKRGTSATFRINSRRVPVPKPFSSGSMIDLPAAHISSSARRTSDGSEALSRVRRKGWPNRPLCTRLHCRGGRSQFVQLAARHPRKTDCGPFHTGHAGPDRCTAKSDAVHPARNRARRPVHTVVSITFKLQHGRQGSRSR